MNKYNFTLLITIIFPITILASSSSINGIVTDSKNGDPLMGANIIIDDTNLGSASNENGEYTINNIPIGTYTIRAMFIGYEVFLKEIKIEANQNYVIDLFLEPSAIELQETKVTGEKRKEKVTGAPAAMEIISTRDIKGKTTTNMGAYLKGLKGVDFTSSGINNYSISVRGFNSSFNTRLLTLTDGRIASIPALRVINYSTIPQSTDDIDKIEVVLGPATALYGANAHSGVVNIVSKSPAMSEGVTMSVSGSNDERQLRKINGRFAKKITNSISIKLSGEYIHAYDWPFISEEEYKAHLYPWTLSPGRTSDGKDNNPSNVQSGAIKWAINTYGDSVRIGNGEPNHGDLDGDGVAGEDWYNGYDDDGDGKIDEDYFTADGIDNDGDGVIDEEIDVVQDLGYDGVDNDQNGIIDDEGGDGLIDSNLKEWGSNIENNILIENGRRDSLINGEINPYYVPDLPWENNGQDLRGHHRYNEELVQLEFDIFTYDYGLDGIPGDPFIDNPGDGVLQVGECLSPFFGLSTACDVGLDGIANTNDFGEGDGIWQPGDGWVDDGDGIIDLGTSSNIQDTYSLPNENNFDDVWPLANGIYDEGIDQIIGDFGNDGIENTGDPGEDGKLIAWDIGENDRVLDTGDGLYGFEGEPFTDSNGNGIRDKGEVYQDINNDNQYNAPDFTDSYQVILDTDGDGMNDYPDFEIDNRRVEFRIDYDPNPDFNMTFQSGYSWTKTQLVTGTGRYLADGLEYKSYQLRGRYKNWFSQFYINHTFSGNTRGYNLGNRVTDDSKNYAYQLQHNFMIPKLNSKLVWGMDYFRTAPFTNGTIINDGPNGYDNDGDNVIIGYNEVDDDLDGIPDDPYCTDGQLAGFRNGKLWDCGEGIDEPDEFINAVSNEYGLYYQSTTELFGTSRYELTTAARIDYHDLLEEGIQFAPKLGFVYKPDSKSSMRFTYGKAYNTPNSISLFTDLFIGKTSVFDIYLRGNYNGTDYCRVGSPCLGEDYPTSVAAPGFFGPDNSTFYTFGPSSNISYFKGYEDRVKGAPYFFQFDSDDILAGDNIPLDTAKNIIFVPELNGDGVLYNAEESINIPNVDPIKTEKIQTIEFGYKGFLGLQTYFTFDYYLSYYEDFFSPPTIITPLVVSRYDANGNEVTDTENLNVQGIMTVNDAATYPPYATAFNGIDDNGDWDQWASEFGWDLDDKNGDGNLQDPGEWGFVIYDYENENGSLVDTIFHPWQILQNKDGYPVYHLDGPGGVVYERHGIGYSTVGVDEWNEFSNLNEHEIVEGANAPDGSLIPGIGVTAAPYHLVLSPMNYGEVWMQGFDFGITHFLSDKIILDGNVSWYGTTEFYNKLTRKNDPINAPKWKWNTSLKWNASFGDIILNLRHVDAFKWSDGIWAGTIGPYNILDLFYTYKFTENLDINLSALNLNNDRHKELVGGAIMGRQIVMRLTSKF